MLNPTGDMGEFQASKAAADEYPINLVRSSEFFDSLEEYTSKLKDPNSRVFSTQRNLIAFWDLIEPQHTQYIETEMRDQSSLEAALREVPKDPHCRFIFLQSSDHRKPLACTRRQLCLLFTHHQVMAPFLDLILTFRRREKPQSYTCFRNEDFIDDYSHQELQSIGRSGIRIQHCFNILAFDQNGKQEWRPRHMAAYHSFDLIQGHALWIIVKGDKKMRDRVKDSTSKPARPCQRNVLDSFKQSLSDHLLLLRWCSENYARYIETLEAEYRHYSSVIEYAPVKELGEDIAGHKWAEKKRTFSIGPASPTTPDTNQVPTNIIRRVTKTFTDFSAVSNFQAQRQLSSGPHGLEIPEPQMKDVRLEELISIRHLQNLNQLEHKLQSAISMIDQNKKILVEIRKRYRDLVNSPALKLHVPEKDLLSTWKQHIHNFNLQISRMEGDLDNHRGNLVALLSGVERMGVVLNGILQYQNMQTTEYFAKASEAATDIMQVWTKQMHEKTLSMHVITLFTLIFLPGTFVATIFSSGILSFGEEGSGGFGPNLGNWKVRLAGLKLFLAICLPLMTLTLCAWLIAYGYARFKNSSKTSGNQGDETDRLEKGIQVG